ncbi:MAG TPA: DNA polymerase III subunit chi [Thiotrichales bacterium]|nr:DNA polymerase III subunit chi [Thiotrichales bacterium]
MTRVDFHILGETWRERRDLYACKVVEKAWKRGFRVHLHSRSPEHARELDRLLWTFRAGSFIPHALYPGEETPLPPVTIGHDIQPEEACQVLVNLADEVPPAFGRFERIIELAGPEEEARQCARQRYRFYRERGYPLETHER